VKSKNDASHASVTIDCQAAGFAKTVIVAKAADLLPKQTAKHVHHPT